MTRAALLATLVAGSAFLTGCSTAEGTADLAITDAPRLAPASPQVGEPVLITAEVWNQGDEPSSGSTLIFQIDGQTRITVPVQELEPGEIARLVTSLTFSSVDYHTVTVIVDPDSTQEDADRGNNTFISGVLVGGRWGG